MGTGGSTRRAKKDKARLDQAKQGAVERLGSAGVKSRYHRRPKVLEDDYEVQEKQLGTGYNGCVKLAIRKDTGKKYAVKPFKLSGVSREKKEELATEAEIILGMDHPHVVRLFDVYESEEQLSLVMECMEGGELFDRVKDRKVFSEKDAASTTWSMLLAINYLHSKSIVHRDLKLENFLYERKDSDFLKLIDFGFSHIWEKNTKMELACGTLSYVAPEVLKKSYTSQCDLWSLGVIVFILLVGYMPFASSQESKVIESIRTGKFEMRANRWSKVSKEGFDFVKKLLEVDPEVRLTAEGALKHPWLMSREGERRASSVDMDHGITSALIGFAEESQFRRACMQVMAWSLNTEERAEVRGAFLEMDKNRTGTVTLAELKQVLEDRFEISEDDAIKVFNALDHQKDGEIHYSEFLAAMVAGRLAMHDGLLQAAFRRFDADGSGMISAENLHEVLHDTSAVDEFMKQADKDHDGQISYSEFIAFVRAGHASDMACDSVHQLIDEEFQKSNPDLTQSGRRIRKRDLLKAATQKLLGCT